MLRQPKLQKRKPEMKTIFQLRERCWPGYKPTPGKKAYAKGSCVKETITLPSDAPSIQSIAKKHGVSEEEIQKQLEMGLKVEQEHTSDVQAATEIALDHLNEKPDYYTRLKTIGEANAAAIAAATAISKKKSGNYDKEGMRKTPYKNPDHPKAKSNEERRKELRKEDIDGTTEQVAGSAQSTLTDKPNREPMKTYKQKNITELSTNLLDRYKEKAAADSAKADKEGNTAKADKRFSGVVKATTKQFDNFKKKGFSEEDTTKKPEGFKSLKPKESEHETYYKFIAGKAKLGKPLSTKERSFAQSYKMAREETEQIAEISAQAHKEYQSAARKDIKANLKHIHGEYGDIAKNIVNRRMKGLAMSNAMTKLKKEEVEQLEENAMHGTVYLHKYHEGPSEDSYGEVGKDHTQHAYKVYHKKLGGKPNLIGDTENNVHNKTKKTAHAVARNDEMEYDHKSHNDAVRHVMDAAGDHPSTPVRYIKDKKQMNEEVEQINEKNVPTSPEKWAQAKSQAKAKFDVYPSAYANGWAAKKYKAMGGGWKSVSEAVKDKFDIGEYDQEGDMAKSDLRSIMANSKKLHDMIEDADNLPEWCQNKITLAEDYISTVANYLTAEMNEEVDLQEKSDDYEVKQSKTDPDVHHVHYKGKKIGYVYGNKKDMWGHEYHAMGTGDDGHSSKREAVSALKADHKHHISGAYMKEEQIDELSKSTLGSYVKKASTNARINSMISKDFDHKAMTARKPSTRDAFYGLSSKHKTKSWKRSDNVAKAVDRLTKEAKEDLPFTPDKPKKQSVVAGKYGKSYSTARHLARTAMQKQVEKMKKQPIKEESRKAAIVKDIMKKKKGSEDAFQKEPELSSTLTKVQ